MSTGSTASEEGARSGDRAVAAEGIEDDPGDAAVSTLSIAGRSLSPVVSILVGSAALIIVLAGLRAVAGIVAPVFLGLIITITLHPLRTKLEGRRLPGWAVSTIMLLLAYVLLAVLIFALLLSMAQLAALIPAYSAELQASVASMGSALSRLGVDPVQFEALTSSLDPARLFDAAMAILSSSFGLVANLFFLATVLLFFAFDTDSTRRGLRSVGRRHLRGTVAALTSFALGTRRYMRVSTNFGLIVAVIDGLVLYALDVPGAFAWAVLAFVTNYIPNIGFVIGVIPPALIALLDSGSGMMLTVIALYSVINFVIQSMIQPRVVGDAVGLSASLTFLSLAFWTWLIGPIGAILAVPLSLLTKALLVEVDPAKGWALPLIAGKPSDDDLEAEAVPAPGGDRGRDPERGPGSGEDTGRHAPDGQRRPD
ncbi:AI-2E family transporter [Brachybacterium sp. YJGR34]|uniref:AI-2E family transporter n=1 Tax=Brachybacterium sp. YJGR34 TaxID=2059911 RepID=UPI00130044D3|nr:AI-2E family transporter [Brachybacterium sp. YJGR34]